MRWLLAVFIVFCGVSTSVAREKATNLFERVDIPVPVRIDKTTVISDFYLNATIKWYREDFAQFHTRNLDSCESSFDRLIDGLCNKDSNTVMSVMSRDVDINIRQKVTTSAVQAFSNLIPKLKVCAQVFGLDERIFICKVDAGTAGGSFDQYFSFSFFEDDDGSYVWKGFQKSSLCSLVQSAFQHSHLDRIGKDELHSTEYSGCLLHNTGDERGKIEFKFNGDICNFNVFSDQFDQNTSPIIRFYVGAYRSLINDPPAGFADNYTAYSREKFIKWADSLSGENYREFLHDVSSRPRRVFFVLNADPIYIVFYSSQVDTLSDVKYEIIYKDADNNYKITNFFVSGFLDDVLNSQDLFVEPVLLPIIRKEQRSQ
jgi:hypothetical protein